jgi:hypothetical protein
LRRPAKVFLDCASAADTFISVVTPVGTAIPNIGHLIIMSAIKRSLAEHHQLDQVLCLPQ